MKIIATLLLAVLYLPLAGADVIDQFDIIAQGTTCSGEHVPGSLLTGVIAGTAEQEATQCAAHCCFDHDYFIGSSSGTTCVCFKKESCEAQFSGGGFKQEAGTDLFKCRAPISPSSGGDPHFTTFGGKKYDFHGGCDLIFLSNPDFDHGKGLFVQGRTQVESWWSRIDAAAVKIGENTLEIKAGKKQIKYWLDGVEVYDMETGDASLGDHAIHFKRINEHQSQTRVDLGGGNALSIETYKLFTRVNVKVAAGDKFAGTYGMYGSYPSGDLLGRDKTTVFEDTDKFGFEWQVRATDPQLFHKAGPIQHPVKCAMPDMSKKSQVGRRLGEVAIAEEDAALACAHVNEHDKDSCIFDVLATNDKDMAGSY